MAVKLIPYDMAEFLKTDEDIADYLEAVLEEEDPALLTRALGNIARARGMTDIAREIGASRGSLYRSLSENGNPSFATVVHVLKALGIQLHVAPTKLITA